MHDRTNATRALAVILLVAVLGCGDSTELLEARILDELGVHLALTADRRVVARGDTVAFTASAHNPMQEAVQIGQHCGPAFDVLVRPPTGARISVLDANVGPHGVFTCELGPWHFVDPGETEELTLRWEAPGLPGVYRARATLRRDEVYLSEPVHVLVE